MPELPEVETVRRGLAAVTRGRSVVAVHVFHDRAVRRQAGGARSLVDSVTGSNLLAVARRGKYLWIELDGAGAPALVAHLGMSGQFRTTATQPDIAHGPSYRGHERVRFDLDDGSCLSFVDQRTFGWVSSDDWGPEGVPRMVSHVALDPLEDDFDSALVAARLRQRHTGVKRALLDQTTLSGVGNIYADEALWQARIHPARATDHLSRPDALRLLAEVDSVLRRALEAGGTSFDPLYVNVNGESGWFARELNAYGRAGQPCRRCGSAIVKEQVAQRSSYRCPRCQRKPRRPAS